MNNMKIEEIITSINNKKIIETNKLKQKKERYEKKEYLVEGIKIVYFPYTKSVSSTKIREALRKVRGADLMDLK